MPTTLFDYVNRLACNFGELPPQLREHAAWGLTWKRLREGVLSASALQGPFGKRQPVAPEFWQSIGSRDAEPLKSSVVKWGLAAIHVSEPPPAGTNGVTTTPQSQSKRYPPEKVEAWYLRRVESSAQEGATPSRDDDLKDARAAFPNIHRGQVRAARKELAPKSWTKQGPRPKAVRFQAVIPAPSSGNIFTPARMPN